MAPTVSDTFRAKVTQAEEASLPSTSLSPTRVERLVSQAAAVLGCEAPRLDFTGGSQVKYLRSGLIVCGERAPRCSVVHAVAHHATDPLFPAHGIEFINNLVKAAGKDGKKLEAELDRLKVHRLPGQRVAVVRKRATGAANREPGVLVRVVLDEPAQVVLGQLLAVDEAGLLVRDETGDWVLANHRLRYFAYSPRERVP